MEFRFKEKGRPINYVCWIAGRMPVYPMHHVLAADYLMTDYDPGTR